MKKQLLILTLSIVLPFIGKTQGNLELFNIYLLNDFEDNTLGFYNYNDWNTDWNYPGGNNRLEATEIRQNNDQANNSKVMRFNFPKGTYSPGYGGGQWEPPLKEQFTEIYFSYDFKFKEGFDWVDGGKLPGLKGGWFDGGLSEYDEGFTVTYMWDSDGGLKFYTYDQDRDYTWGRGVLFYNFKFETGKWYNITMRVVLNSVGENGGNNDAIIEGYIDGKMYAQSTYYLNYRNLESIKIDKLKIYSFFGGDDISYASTRDEWIDFDNFILFTYKDNVDVPRGRTPSSDQRILILPDFGEQNVTLPPTPKNVAANAISDTEISLSWSKSENTTSYIIESSQNQNGPFSAITALNSNITSYSDQNLKSNTNYYYRIKSTNYIGSSGYCNIVNAKTDIDPLTLAPNTPDNLKANLEGDQILLSWNDNSNDENNFIIEYKINQSGLYESLSVLANNTSTYTYNSNPDIDTVKFRIAAQNNYGKSGYSEVLCIRNTNQTLDVNTSPVILAQTFEVKMDNKNDLYVANIIANDADKNQKISYSIKKDISSVFAIDQNSGVLSMKDLNLINPYTYQTYILEIEVTDNGTKSLSNSANITVNVIAKQNFVFIDPTNINDQFEDGSYNNPYDSWQDVTWTDGNHYAQKSGTKATEDKILIMAENVSIEAYGKGPSPILKSTTDDYALKVFEKSNITIKNIEIQAPEGISCIYFMGGTCNNNTVENCKLVGSEYGLRIIEGKKFYIQYNVFENKTEAIYSNAENNYIYYNIFKNAETAINIVSYLSEAEVYNNVFYGNNRGVSTSYAYLKMYNNIFYLLNEGDEAIYHSLDKLISDHNIFYPQQEGFININNKRYSELDDLRKDLNIDLNSLTNNPMFVDIYNDNFSVVERSPSINKGIYLGLNKDFYGAIVPFGIKPDIGLMENQDINIFNSTNDLSNNNDLSIIIYPNPASTGLQIKINDLDNNYTNLLIQDISGRTMYNLELTSDMQNKDINIDISNFPNGIYYAVFKNNTTDFVEKIIKI